MNFYIKNTIVQKHVTLKKKYLKSTFTEKNRNWKNETSTDCSVKLQRHKGPVDSAEELFNNWCQKALETI